MNAIAGQLSTDSTVTPVSFDAWRYEGTEHIVVPLLYSIYSELDKLRNDSLTEKVRAALVSVARSLTISFGPLSISGDRLVAADEGRDITNLDIAFGKPYRDMQAIAQSLGGHRIAVLIDDLDRCSSDKVVGLLEAINLVMDVPGFIFVLALDYDVLARAVSIRYPHASGHVFIEKMVQVPFRVPRLDLPQVGFLRKLIPNWTDLSTSFPQGFEQIVYDVATFGLEANPRQIKRLINSVLVLLSVARDHGLSTDARLLAGLVGIQLRWPTEYRDFAESVLAGDASPLMAITPDDQPLLRRYSERFFPANVSGESLRLYLQLTQSVAIPDISDSYDSVRAYELNRGKPAAVIREEHRRGLIEALIEKGYKPSSPTSNTYTSEQYPDLRVAFGKAVVRFEARNKVGGKWVTGVSCYLTNEYGRALRLVRNPDAILRNPG